MAAALWGEDASTVDEKGVGKGLSKFFPACYNTFVNCWLDGSALWLGTPGAHANNAHVGDPNFGNYVVRNRIRSPHSYRTGFEVNPHAGAGISVGGGSGRARTSHTIVRLHGVFLKEGETVERVDTDTGQKDLDNLEDERTFEAAEIARSITALAILLQRPKDWCSAVMDDLRAALHQHGFEPERLQRAHRAKGFKALADVISIVKHAAAQQAPLHRRNSWLKCAVQNRIPKRQSSG